MYIVANSQACGGAAKWSRDGGDTRRHACSGLRWLYWKAAPRLPLSNEHGIHANLTRVWKRQLQEVGAYLFAANGERKQGEQGAQEAKPYERIEGLKIDLEWPESKVALPRSVRYGEWSTAGMGL